ncbi:MAG TPA: hypothetical protein VJ895_02700 [Candidatus Nanoarchaeia archaeon]|nr:hypothetical protein [Candidatus Nanoarchaeia archaeon]
MDINTVTEKIERFKFKAELFLRKNLKVFLKDIYDNYHFCEIISLDKDWVIIKHFKGKREGEKVRILWADILIIDEYREAKKFR